MCSRGKEKNLLYIYSCMHVVLLANCALAKLVLLASASKIPIIAYIFYAFVVGIGAGWIAERIAHDAWTKLYKSFDSFSLFVVFFFWRHIFFLLSCSLAITPHPHASSRI